MSTPPPASASLTSVRKSASVLVRGRFHAPNQSADVADGLARFLVNRESENVILLQTTVSTQLPEGSKVVRVTLEGSETLSDLKAAIDKRLQRENEPVTLVIRSLDGLLAQFEVNPVSRFLTSLISTKTVRRVLTFELNRCAEADCFTSLFQTVIAVKGGQSEDQSYESLIKHRPDIGKPTSARESFSLNASGDVTNVTKVSVKTEEKKELIAVEEKDEREAISRLASFNLGLKEGEKTARDKVVLPFWKEEQKAKVRTEEEEEGEVRINKRTEEPAGLIHYEPDDGDDWDEEDPDDDLDF